MKRRHENQEDYPTQTYEAVDRYTLPYSNDDPNEPDDDTADYDDEVEDTHRFHVAMNVFNLISVLAGLAVILVLVAVLVSLVTWLQGDVSQSLTLLTANIK